MEAFVQVMAPVSDKLLCAGRKKLWRNRNLVILEVALCEKRSMNKEVVVPWALTDTGVGNMRL